MVCGDRDIITSGSTANRENRAHIRHRLGVNSVVDGTITFETQSVEFFAFNSAPSYNKTFLFLPCAYVDVMRPLRTNLNPVY